MFKKQEFPIQLFLFFEKVSSNFWTSTALKPNHGLVFLPSSVQVLLYKVLRLELYLGNSFLVDSSIIDMTQYADNWQNSNNLWGQSRFLFFSIIYFYTLKYKLTLFTSLKHSIESVDTVYLNANWLEREASEMYGINFIAKADSRVLLLDYLMLDAPMLKNYLCSGQTETQYNLLDDTVALVNNSVVEL